MKVEDFLKQNKPEIKEIKYHIEKAVQKQELMLIYLDNNEKIYVGIEEYFNYGLNTVEGIDEALYTKLKDEERIVLGYRSALRKLSIKDFSVKQIEDHLKIKKQLNTNEVKIIISKLKEYGLLDDVRYCTNRINYLNKQQLSCKQIKIKLKKEGISNNIIDEYLDVNNTVESLKADNIAIKLNESIKNKSTNAKKQMILTKLLNLGFSYDISLAAIDKLAIIVDNEEELLKKEYNKVKNKYIKKYEGYELKNHIYASLLNKGFNNEDIKKVLEVENGKAS